jgi:hypothetical protein
MTAATPQSIADEYQAAMIEFDRALVLLDEAEQRLPEWGRRIVLPIDRTSPEYRALAKAEEDAGIKLASRRADWSGRHLDAIHDRLAKMTASSPAELLVQANALQNAIELEGNDTSKKLCATLIAGLKRYEQGGSPRRG